MADTTRSGQDYTGPDRRKNLPTMELWQENIRALNQCSLSNCQMRYALTSDELTFLVRFENEIPVGRLNFVFPDVDKDRLVGDGWKRFVLTVSITDEGRLSVDLWGRYERDSVPLDIKGKFVRDIGLGIGVAEDVVSFVDTRNGTTEDNTLQQILDTKLKSGEPKYARKDDSVSSISVEGMIAVLTRYFKDSAVRRRVLPGSQNPT
ncbi:MAG: hypothetical protein J7M25_12815 [Deltaproteobacteria bacterium]|nr:hypothetical protein [Deltaproteobacteria bacterium]